MTAADRLTKLVTAVAAALECPSLHVDEQGVCALLVDGIISVSLSLGQTKEWFVLSAPLGAVPTTANSAWLLRLLRANSAGNAAYTFGMAAASNTAILYSCRPSNSVDVIKLVAWIGAFAATAKPWRTALANGDTPDLS